MLIQNLSRASRKNGNVSLSPRVDESTDDGKADKNQGNPFNTIRAGGPLLGAGIQMAAAVVAMFFLGRWLDTKFGTDPWLMITGIFFGVGGGMYTFIKTVSDVDKAEVQKKDSLRP